MATVADCIEKLVASGQISRAMADEARGLFERSQAEFSATAGPASADAAAAVTAAKQLRERAVARQAQIAATVKAYQIGERRILEDPRGRNAALAGMLSKDTTIGDNRLKGLLKSQPDHPIFSGGNADYRALAIKDKMFAMMGPDLDKMRTGFLPDAKLIASAKNFIRERFGVSTGDAVSKGVSDAFGKIIDYGTARAKAAGRVFNELEDWRVFQHWTPSRVVQFSADQYVADHMAEISNGGLKLWDKETGVYAAASKYDEILRRAYSDIKTEGSSTTPFSKDMRTFQFQPGRAGADAWLKLQAKYGVGNEIISTLAQHVEHMSRTIALHEQFGGQPDAVFAGLLRLVKDDPSAAVKGFGWLTSPGTLKLTYDGLSGRGEPVASETAARVMSGMRQLVGTSTLRNLPITIIPGDAAMTLMAAKHLGMDGFKVLSELGSLTKEEASHLQVQAAGYADFLNNSVRRYENQINLSGLVRKVSRGVVKLTGADWWTTNGRQGWQSSMLAFMAAQSGRAFDQLPQAFRDNFLRVYGLGPAEWDTIRQAAPMVASNGARYIDPTAIPAPLSERMMAGVKEQGSYAFHQPDARTQALVRGGAEAGTIHGEIRLALMQYKQFALERMTTHLMRILVDGPMENRIARGSAFTLLSLAAGAVSLQAAAVLAGKDPLDMTRPQFWLGAFAKGGGGGIYADMLAAAMSGRDAASVLGQAAGPVPGMVMDAAQAVIGPAKQEIDPTGRRTPEQMASTNAFQAMKRWTPSTWYTKLAVDRLIWDKMQVLADPNFRQSFVRLQKNAQKQGSGFWWAPGQSAPTRGPDFLSAIGTSR